MKGPRLNSPLYEDGPWLKDPIGPDMFRHRQLGTPGINRVNDTLSQKNAGGSQRTTTTEPSIGSSHKANKSNQYDDAGKRNSKSKGNR